MSDNVAITAGTGTTVATDDIGGVHYQRVKGTLGADGTAVDISAGAGAVGTGVQRITLASDDPAVAILGAAADAASTTTTIKAALRGVATALGITAFDLGSGTGGTRTLRTFLDTANTALLKARYVQLVPTSNTDAHTSGDLIAATEILAAVTPADDVVGTLSGMTAVRLDSVTGIDIRVWFLKANSSMGTESSAFAVADADADDILGYVDFAAGDFVTLAATNCFAQKRNVNLPLVPVAGSDDVYIGVTALGAVDLGAATDLVLNFHCI